MKYMRYMLCLGLLFDHSLRSGNICSGQKDAKKSSSTQEHHLENDSVNLMELKGLFRASMENDDRFVQFTRFIRGIGERSKKTSLNDDSIHEARDLLVWAIDEMDVKKIQTKPVYRCWAHNVGELVNCLERYTPGQDVDLPDDFFQPLDVFEEYDQYLKGRIFPEQMRVRVDLPRDVIVAWVDEVARTTDQDLLRCSHLVNQSRTSEQLAQIQDCPHAVNMEL